MKSFLPLFCSLSATFAASTSYGCPPQNENLFLPEYDGQETVSVGYIDTSTSLLSISNDDFYVLEVSMDGIPVCPGADNQPCPDNVQLGEGPLGASTRVEIVLRTFSTSPENRSFVFDRNGAARNSGSLCRPIFPRN